jgi:hypothetical protein
MQHTVVFVDFENVHELHAAEVPPHAFVMFFRGAKQKAIDDETLDVILTLGRERFTPITLTGEGHNALDFHVAYYLGVELSQHPTSTCIVLSKDAGFDPLIQHLQNRGFDVSRREPLSRPRKPPAAAVKATAAVKPATFKVPAPAKAAALPKAPKPPPKLADVVAFVAAYPVANRPRKRASLVRAVGAHYNGCIDAQQAEVLVAQLLATGKVAEKDGKLAFQC